MRKHFKKRRRERKRLKNEKRRKKKRNKLGETEKNGRSVAKQGLGNIEN